MRICVVDFVKDSIIPNTNAVAVCALQFLRPGRSRVIGHGAQVRRKAIPNTFWELSELAGCSGGEIETVGHARELYSKLGFQLVPGDGLLAFPFPLPFGGAEVSGVLTIFHFFQDGQVFQRDQGSHIFPSTAHNDPFSLTSHAI
ncbi:MAG: hypothetical protein A3G81_30240 [Betaproteobacteria bacterium RIFCSPLOWO2_12_FULL_65_14]|nr:MAG: hypothetical protein A3G81_30240 [Betaproteobacteria bacterium RIFCSPLOWO2_12_FULL_65_14]